MKYLLLIIATVWCYTGIGAEKSDKDQPKNSAHYERVQAREARHVAAMKQMDSVILSHNFIFTPTSFQREPAGSQREIYQPYYAIQIAPDFTDIYIPYIKGITPPYMLTVLNYTLSSSLIDGYMAVQGDDTWTVTFKSTLFGLNTYTFKFMIYAVTGEATLTLSSNVYNDVTYNGSITPR